MLLAGLLPSLTSRAQPQNSYIHPDLLVGQLFGEEFMRETHCLQAELSFDAQIRGDVGMFHRSCKQPQKRDSRWTVYRSPQSADRVIF